jgi:8-oxo-dGTP pyrophosphatase MutT (NUDIX family)
MSRRAHLKTLLDELQPQDAMLREQRARMLALLANAKDPFARESYQPGHFTASAFIFDPAQRALLLILHGKLGLWLQPGGHIDPDDTDVIAAARREVSEEVGLSDLELASPGLFDIDIHEIPARGSTPVHQHFDLRFLFLAQDRLARAGSDARDARWVPLQEIEALHSDASVVRIAMQLNARARTR